METDRLRYFCSIVDAGSLTKAAEMLGMSHSGLSKAMSALQDELGFAIFTPKGRGLELTENGKVLYQQSQKILEFIGSIRNRNLSLNSALRIAFPEALALATTEAISQELKQNITIEDLDSGEIETRLLDGKIDFGFTFIPFPHRELDHLKVGVASYASFCRVGTFQNENPERIPYVIPSHEIRDNPLSIKIRDGWNIHLTRFTPYRANSLSIALRMVQAGTCAIYAPYFLIAALNKTMPKDLQIVHLNLDPKRRALEKTRRDVFLVKRGADEESRPMKAVVKAIRRVLLGF
jgi:DNA-binding transcriptional LysR family regulator